MACVKKDAGDGHSFEDIVQMQEISPNIYQSALLGKEAVPNQKMNYGGWTMAIALKASNLTVDPKYHPYSMTGSFLGPSSPHKPLIAKVRILRSTRSFQTRFVEISQTQDNGDSRICLTFTADYQAQEAGTVLEYSAPPGLNYSKPDDCPTIAGYIDEYASKGLITEDEAARSRNFRYFFANYFVQKDCPESAFAQQLLILNKMFPGAAGVQADKKITDKKSGCWFKNVRPLSTINQAPGLAFVMDGCLPIVSPAHAGLSWLDFANCNSLDFALRIFVNDLSLDDWMLREWTTVVGGEGRTYSESRVWDQSGRMICSMTQQCILRPVQQAAAKL